MPDNERSTDRRSAWPAVATLAILCATVVAIIWLLTR